MVHLTFCQKFYLKQENYCEFSFFALEETIEEESEDEKEIEDDEAQEEHDDGIVS